MKTKDLSKYMKRDREKRKAKGLCTSCGNRAEKGRVRCTACRERHRKRDKLRTDKFGVAGRCRSCGSVPEKGKTCESCKKRARESSREASRRLRNEVLDAYGAACACCGETERVFLCIDHVNNDGAEHRKKVGSVGVYRSIIKNNFPPEFQVLCWNCNMAKQILGTCPHQCWINTVLSSL